MSEETLGHPPHDTPRTNAASIEINRPGKGDKLDWISFARQLERELNLAAQQPCGCEKLREALEKIDNQDISGRSFYVLTQECWDIAREALAQPCGCQEAPAKDILMPKGLDFRNGGQSCDMLAGPCACGAWHKLEDLPFRIFNQLKAEQTPAKWRVGDHNCEYASESEEARCAKCGLTSGEAIKYLERQQTPASAGSEEWTVHVHLERHDRFTVTFGTKRFIATESDVGMFRMIAREHNAALRRVSAQPTVEAWRDLGEELASMIIKWVEGGINGGTNWRNGLAEVITKRLQRRVTVPQSSDNGITCEGLHPDTLDLVLRFAQAMADKLRSAQDKYGYIGGWWQTDWREECQTELLRHLEKGDPRDMANYCAFLWHHGWPTKSSDKTAGAVRKP